MPLEPAGFTVHDTFIIFRFVGAFSDLPESSNQPELHVNFSNKENGLFRNMSTYTHFGIGHQLKRGENSSWQRFFVDCYSQRHHTYTS